MRRKSGNGQTRESRKIDKTVQSSFLLLVFLLCWSASVLVSALLSPALDSRLCQTGEGGRVGGWRVGRWEGVRRKRFGRGV